jgi:hypothetical protein
MAAGWNVRVMTFDSKGKPGIVRNFLAYEADKERAIELVRKRVPVHEGELAEAVAEVPRRKKQALFQEECTPPLWNPPAQQTLEYQC